MTTTRLESALIRHFRGGFPHKIWPYHDHKKRKHHGRGQSFQAPVIKGLLSRWAKRAKQGAAILVIGSVMGVGMVCGQAHSFFPPPQWGPANDASVPINTIQERDGIDFRQDDIKAGRTDNYLHISTDIPMGTNTKEVWKIVGDFPAKPDLARLSVVGVKRGGLIDHYLDNRTTIHKKMAVDARTDRRKKKQGLPAYIY